MVLAPLMIELSVWIIAFGVLVFCILAVYIAKAFFGVAGGTLGKLPVVGGWISSGISSVEHKIVSVMSVAAAGAQSLCGAALHVVARQIDWMGREIKSHSNLLAALALLSLGVVDFKALSKALRGVQTQAHGTAGVLTHTNHRLDNAERRLEHVIGADILPRIRGLEREVDHVIEHDIASLRKRARTLDREYERLFKWMKTNTRAWGTLAFAGAVAVALNRLGLKWLRCNSLGRVGRTIGCRGFGLFEDLLALGLEVLVVADICQIANAIESAAILVEPELDKLVGLSDFLCRGGGASYPSAIVGSDRKGRGGHPSALIAADLAA